jgi:hypothetical protein
MRAITNILGDGLHYIVYQTSRDTCLGHVLVTVCIMLLFMWSASLCHSDRTGPLLSSPWSEHTWRNLSAVKWYTSDAEKAMQHNNNPQEPAIETQLPNRPMPITGSAWVQTTLCYQKLEPSGLHPKRGTGLDWKPGAHTLKLPSTVWAAELRDAGYCGGSLTYWCHNRITS